MAPSAPFAKFRITLLRNEIALVRSCRRVVLVPLRGFVFLVQKFIQAKIPWIAE